MDHTKKTTFVGFINVEKGDKYWIDHGFTYNEDAPGLFRYNTKEEKDIAKSVAQSYIDNWGIKAVEMVVLEVKSRHSVNLTKRSDEEREAERHQIQEAARAKRLELADDDNIRHDAENEQSTSLKKKRGRKPKIATI